MDIQLIVFAAILLALMGGMYLMFRKPPEQNPDQKDDNWY